MGDSSIRTPGKSSQTAKRPAICMGVRRGELVGHQPCSITLWWLVRVRPASPRSRLEPEKTRCPLESYNWVYEIQSTIAGGGTGPGAGTGGGRHRHGREPRFDG